VRSVRILQLSPYHYPFLGGIEHRIHHLSKRLARSNEVIVVTSRLDGTEREEEMDGYRVVRLDSRFIDIYNPPFVSSKGVLAALERLEPDIVDFHYRWAPSYTRQALKHEGKMVFTYHNTFGEGEGALRALSYLNDWAFMRRMHRFDKVICISEFVRKDNAKHGLPMEKMVVVPNGVELPSRPSREEDFILSLGRMVHTKGLEYLVRAMHQVDMKLVMAGVGPEKERMVTLAKSQGIEDRVEILGRVSEDLKDELFATCKLFVMPSLFESYGIAAAEAMSYGKAVVATDVGGLPEVIGDCGALVPPKDSQALADEINLLLDNDELRRELGARALDRARSFSWDRVAKMQEDVYRQVVEGPSG
jgi:glycosyltransferase involved in cell wall biosynthesis